MKKLFIVRHAKSSWEHPGLSDFDRPLNERGLETAPFMGRYMAEKAYVPELIVSSPARRAAETASLLKEAAGFDAELRFDERIYEASSAALLDVVNNVEETFATLMLVGHNPGTEDFIHYLTGSVEVMPTAALAVIDLDISSWRDAKLHSGRLVQVIRPKKARKG